MKLLKLIKSESGQLQLPPELANIQLPHYRSDLSKIARYHENSSELGTIPESPNNINSCTELVNSNDKSDYLIFSDFYNYTYDAGNVKINVRRLTYTGDDNRVHDGTYDEIHASPEGLPDNDSELTPYYINYTNVKSFDLVDIPVPLIPSDWGDVIDLTISFWKSNSNDRLTVTKSIKLSQDIQTTVIHYIDTGTELGPINYDNIVSTYTNESGTGDILWSEFRKGVSVNAFEVVSCYNNLFVYCMDSSISDYYISSCKLNKCINGI